MGWNGAVLLPMHWTVLLAVLPIAASGISYLLKDKE